MAVAQNVPRAVPVDEPPRALPVEDGTGAAQTGMQGQGQGQPQQANKPTGPDEDLYEYATLCFAQKDYAIAVKPLSDYVRLHPQGRHAAEAWFRLGECHRELGDAAQAKRAYNEVLTRHAKTESAASAAYRMGAMAYTSGDFLSAGAFFNTCSRITSSPNFKLPALYNSAIAWEQGGDSKKAIAAYQQVAAIKPPNKYRETALLKVANASLEADKKQEALTAFNDLIAITGDNDVLGDALLRSGLILNEMGKTEEALKNFQRVLKIGSLPEAQRGMALFGIIQASYLKKDYDTVIKSYTSNATTIPPGDIHAKQLLLVGNAQKQKQSYRQAIETFLLLEKTYPETPEALDAGYQKLLAFYQLGDQSIPDFTTDFENRYVGKYPEHEYLTMSRLIRADWYFGKADYKEASSAFSGIDLKQVPEKVLPSVLYKKGFCEVEADKNTEAIATLSTFLKNYPNDPNVPAALAQRGIAQKNVRAFDKALEDFATVIKNHAGHPALEMALYQSGYIKGDTRDFKGMVADYEQLLEKFPKSAAAAEVNFRIGEGYRNLNDKKLLPKALDPLRRSIELDRDSYLDKASQALIGCLWLLEDVDAMSTEVDKYLDSREGATVNPKALTFLGVNYFNRNNYEKSERYLSLASTPEQPEATEAPVWNLLGMARNEVGRYAGAVMAFENYLGQTPSGEGHARGLLGKGRALLGVSRYDEAQKCTSDALNLIKEGKLKAQLQLLDGDIYNARAVSLKTDGDNAGAKAQWEKALAQFVIVSQIFVDPDITPVAAWKAADVMEKTGEDKKATAMREQVKTKYPKFEPKSPAPLIEEPEPAPSPVEETKAEELAPANPPAAIPVTDDEVPAAPMPTTGSPPEAAAVTAESN